MKRILVLGGTGAMGVYLVEYLSTVPDMEVLVTSRSTRQNYGNVKYILGNARNPQCMNQLLSDNHYDCIVDFMNYNYEEFEEWHLKLLGATSHYIFLSSSRVYANSAEPLTEESPRLLNTTRDKDFLATNRYALRKAREEDMLNKSGFKNFTIIRPYITYSDRRLQLGICEKEDWLYRVLNDKEILFSEGVLDKRTTLTFGEDVSFGIAQLILKDKPLGGGIHITTNESITWGSILALYNSVLQKEVGKSIHISTSGNIRPLEEIYEGGYNTIYDRQWDRCFCNAKAERMCGHIEYKSMSDGLTECLTAFLNAWKSHGNSIFLPLNDAYHSMSDKMLKDDSIKRTKVII